MESPCKLGYQFILDIVMCFEHNKREGLRRTSHKEILDHIHMYVLLQIIRKPTKPLDPVAKFIAANQHCWQAPSIPAGSKANLAI